MMKRKSEAILLNTKMFYFVGYFVQFANLKIIVITRHNNE